MSTKTILITGYFNAKKQERKLRYTERLHDALQTLGYNLIIVNGGQLPPETDYPVISCPTDIVLPHRIQGNEFLSREDLPPWLLRAAAVETEARECSFPATAFRLLLYSSWMREVLDQHKPALCLIWHQFNGPHHVLRTLCEERRLPFLFVEYGLLPGTIAFDAEGQMGEGRVTLRHQEFNALPVDDSALSCARHLLALIRDTRKSPKAQTSKLDIPSLAAKLREKTKAIIFYAGQNDWGAGMLPKPFKEARLHSPVYEDTLDALNHLSELAEANNWHVLFKPHPLIEHRHTSFEVSYPERVTLVPGANIFQCMEQADVCTTILSQAAYLFLIHNRPCVLLGRHQLYGSNSAYVAEERDGVEDLFRQALSEGFSASQQTAFEEHTARLCRYYLYGMDEDAISIMGRGQDHAAASIHTFIKGKHRDAGFPFARDLPDNSNSITTHISKVAQRIRRRKQ